jgi:hypothetical protein
MTSKAEIADIRFDIEVLEGLIDRTLGKGAPGEDIMLRALANVLQDRRTRLEQLERAAGNSCDADDELHHAQQG